MKSIYILFSEALAALKATASASKYEEVYNSFPKRATVEVQLNIVEATLAELTGLTVTEVNSQLHKGVAFTIKESASRLENIEEHQTRIKKNNGAADNGHGEAITEVDRTITKKEALVESVMKSENISEAEARVVMGLKPKGPEGLTRAQLVEYNFARRIGISEADSLVLAKLPFKAANQRF
jgi:hypothetical protein